jgi:hypothetical protein
MFGIDDAIMAAVAPAVIGGAMDMAGGMFGNNANKDIAQQANQFASAQSDKQMAFQREMRATQYQTTVEDLKKAGLNPMLAYTQGGAGTPSGAQAQPTVAHMENPMKGATQTAIGAANVAADLKLKKEQALATSAQAEASNSQALSSVAAALKMLEESKKPSQEIENLKKQLDVMASQITANNAQAGASSAQAAKTKQETDLGIVSSNPITQGWGEVKRAAQYLKNPANRNNTKGIKLWGNSQGK